MMESNEKLRLAIKAIDEMWDFEKLKYSDDLYKYEGEDLDEISEDIWAYVEEFMKIGSISFNEKYNLS